MTGVLPPGGRGVRGTSDASTAGAAAAAAGCAGGRRRGLRLPAGARGAEEADAQGREGFPPQVVSHDPGAAFRSARSISSDRSTKACPGLIWSERSKRAMASSR